MYHLLILEMQNERIQPRCGRCSRACNVGWNDWLGLLSFERMKPQFGHFLCIRFKTGILDAIYAS
jgi:hypothetical protein